MLLQQWAGEVLAETAVLCCKLFHIICLTMSIFPTITKAKPYQTLSLEASVLTLII